MKLINLIAILLLVGCAAVPVGPKSTEMNKVSLGMSKNEVISAIGKPNRVSAKERITYLIYLLVDDVDYTQSSITLGIAPPQTTKSEYFVELQNNSVVSYGKVGDSFVSSYTVADDVTLQVEKYANSIAYAVGCAQENPGKYMYIEKTMDTLNDGLREYMKENPENVDLLKSKSLVAISNFKKLPANEKYITCNSIDNKLKDLH